MKKVFWIILILCLTMPLGVHAFDGSSFDVDNDGDVDAEDLAGFVQYFGTSRYYKDIDNDHYSDGTVLYSASPPANYVLGSELVSIDVDCDDENANVNPGMDEICDDGLDNDCNGLIDDCNPSQDIFTIEGDISAISGDLLDPNPSVFDNMIDFYQGFSVPDNIFDLSYDATEIYEADNSGGSSVLSKVISMEILFEELGAVLLKTETEIVYDTTGDITDFLVAIDNIKIGVKVTRAFHYPSTEPITSSEAYQLLTNKLTDIIQSSENVSDEDKWQKQILHIITPSVEEIDIIRNALEAVDAEIKADTIVLISATIGDDSFLYE
jgi:hypothetical protein